MISVDVETTGVIPTVNGILSIGAVDMSNPSNTFYGECKPWDGAVIEAEALAVNGFDINEIQASNKISEGELIIQFVEWVKATEKDPLMCGMNVCFDRDFIKYACERIGIKSPFKYRTVDVHAVAWYYITIYESKPPKNLSLNRVMEMLGAGREPDPHNALTGAMCSAECISRMLSGKSLFPDIFNK